MTIDEAINKYIKLKIFAEVTDDKRAKEEYEQLVYRLEELKELRKIKEDYSKCMQTSCATFMYNKVIDDFANTLTENYDYLPQILSQEAFGGYIDEYAAQLKAGRENE